MRSYFTSLPKIGIYLSVLTKRLIEPLEKEEVDFISLDRVISDLDGTSNYFLDLFNNKGFDLGILRLRKGELDSQLPHPVNEVYFVVDGNGVIEIEGELKPVRNMTSSLLPQMYDTNLLQTIRI